MLSRHQRTPKNMRPIKEKSLFANQRYAWELAEVRKRNFLASGKVTIFVVDDCIKCNNSKKYEDTFYENFMRKYGSIDNFLLLFIFLLFIFYFFDIDLIIDVAIKKLIIKE